MKNIIILELLLALLVLLLGESLFDIRKELLKESSMDF